MMEYGSKVILMDTTLAPPSITFRYIHACNIDDLRNRLPTCSMGHKQLGQCHIIGMVLKAVYKSVRDVETAYFMSDCAEQYYNAWSFVYGANNTKRLLCI